VNAEATELPVGEAIPGVAEAINQTFVETDPKNPKRTRAVLVMVGGKIVGERYADGITPQTRLLSWSMAKSFTSALVGILVGQGRLDIHRPAPVPEWQAAGDSRAAITVDQLLRMSSGLEFQETYADKPVSDVNRMLFLEPDTAAYAASLPLIAKPDSEWNYSSGSTAIVSRVIRKTFGGDEAYYAFPYRTLFGPLGMASAEWGVDASGTYIGSSYIYATARDFARFGQLALHDGVWNGQRLLPEGWMTYATTPTPTDTKATYGAGFWLNAKQLDYPEVPADLSYADGHNGQEIFFSPSLDLVAVRLGMTWEGDWGSKEFLITLTKALKK
jgi:CubicO group peptidase (beta-lactamase class C family)